MVLADEPTSMLDVSIRAGVLNLLEEMKHENDMAMMYITHDIATARYLAEDIAVMYVGHMVEWGDTEEVIHHPKHPYTKLLISAVPDPSKFAGRCTHATAKCTEALPEVTQLGSNHFVRCHLFTS